MTTLSLVIPAYNEETRLPALLDVLGSSATAAIGNAGFELAEALVVDDGSTDGTRERLREAAVEQTALRALLDFDRNRGKGAAVAAGVKAARSDYVLLADVDLSTPLEELHKLADAVRSGADVAIGSRAVEGATVKRGPAHRKLLGRSFNGVVRILTGLDTRDTQCGFKLMPTAVGKRLLAAQICPGFAFDVELLMRADAAGLSIAEVPVLYVHDSRSSIRVASASWRMFTDVCGLAYRLRVRGEADAREAGRQHSLSGLSADNPD